MGMSTRKRRLLRPVFAAFDERAYRERVIRAIMKALNLDVSSSRSGSGNQGEGMASFMLNIVGEALAATSGEVTEDLGEKLAAGALSFLLPCADIPDTLKFKDVRYENGRFVIIWESISTHASCPSCHHTSKKQVSSHLRSEMVQDLPIRGTPVWHRIRRKKYVCTNDHCVHVNFLEGFSGFVADRCSRMTSALVDYIISVATETSDLGAERILKGQGVKINRKTIDRLILKYGGKLLEQNCYDDAAVLVNVGIDDINLRKGNKKTACMVVVDLVTKKILLIARGTTAKDAKNVLAMFPNIKIVSRDRSTAMASAADEIGAISVADGFHLVENMHDAIKDTLYDNLPSSIYVPIGDSWVLLLNDRESEELVTVSMPSTLTEEDIRVRVRMAHLSPKEEQTYRNTLRILELTAMGKHAEEIAVILDLTIEKVRSLRKGIREEISRVESRIDAFCENPLNSVKKQKSVTSKARSSTRSIVEPYRETVTAMRRQGCSHWTIYEELKKLGFKGCHSTVDNYIIKLSREGSIESEMKETYRKTKNPADLIPNRPGRIAVSIQSVNSVYERVLAKIRAARPKNADSLNAAEPNEADQGKRKRKGSLAPKHNRSGIPLGLAHRVNWLDTEEGESKPPPTIEDRYETIDRLLETMFPVFNDMVSFGIDFHNFLDNNDLDGLIAFIEKYTNSKYGRIAQFANGLKKDIQAVKNAMLYPDISNGLVEGYNNLVKTIKRMGGNRMKIDFLTCKVLLKVNVMEKRAS
jgi:transposase